MGVARSSTAMHSRRDDYASRCFWTWALALEEMPKSRWGGISPCFILSTCFYSSTTHLSSPEASHGPKDRNRLDDQMKVTGDGHHTHASHDIMCQS